jgi:hypothetical protein
LGLYTFEGPFSSINELEDREGIFAVICIIDDTISHLVHVEEANHIRSNIKNNVKTTEWVKSCKGRVAFGADYTPNLQKPCREMIVREILKKYG